MAARRGFQTQTIFGSEILESPFLIFDFFEVWPGCSLVELPRKMAEGYLTSNNKNTMQNKLQCKTRQPKASRAHGIPHQRPNNESFTKTIMAGGGGIFSFDGSNTKQGL